VPEFNISELLNWIQDESDIYYERTKHSSKNVISSELISVFRNHYIKDSNGWVLDFDKRFPDIIEFLDSLPIIDSCWNLVEEIPSKTLKGTYIHIDDPGEFGLRVYLNYNGLTPRLYAYKDTTNINKYAQLNALDGTKAVIKDGYFVPNTDILHSEYKQTTMPTDTNRFVFLLNNITAAHAGEIPQGNETKLLLFPHSTATDFAKLDIIMERSAIKYKKSALIHGI